MVAFLLSTLLLIRGDLSFHLRQQPLPLYKQLMVVNNNHE